jgi:predicted RecB family endonuclease
MQSTALTKAILKTFKTGDADDAALADVVKLAKRMKREAFEPLAQRLASTKYNVPLITKSTGKVVFDSSADKYETARKRVQRLVKAIYETSQSTEEVEIPAELLKLAQALAKAASKYEGARSLASKALAQALAK